MKVNIRLLKKILLSPPVLNGFGSGIGTSIAFVILFAIVAFIDYTNNPSKTVTMAPYESLKISSPAPTPKQIKKLEFFVHIRSDGSSLSDARTKLEETMEKVKEAFKNKSMEVNPEISYFNVGTYELHGASHEEILSGFSGNVNLKFLIDYPHPALDDLSNELATMSGVSSTELRDPR